MKKLLLYALFLLTVFPFTDVKASHIIGGEIRISPLSGVLYRMELSVYRDITGVSLPNSVVIDAFQRVGMNQVDDFTLILDSTYLIPPITTGCGSPLLGVEHALYSSDTVRLYPSTFNHQGGYIFRWRSCCRNAGVANVQNSSSSGTNVVTLFPPVVDSAGNAFINSTPILNSPISDFAIQNHPYYLNFGGMDPDGDSLSFALYSPFEYGMPDPGIVTAISSPYPDPTTQFPPIQWANCFNQDNQINGMSNSSCSSNSEQDRLKINPQTGELTMVPGSPAPAYYVYGIWCREYRNGKLIGSIFRDYQISITDYQIDPNNAPQVHVPQLQSLASWDADTMIFTGSPVCIQIGVTDPDSIADIEIETVYSDYDPGDLTFVQNSAIIFNPDTFQTALCFQPDSFLPYTTRGDVVALNPGCYDLRGDTLPFYFKFVGYSNAGWGGTKTVPMTASNGTIDLFSLLSNNPLSGGDWYDLDGNNHMNPNGFLEWKYITTPKTYRFIYVQQEPNYPQDTAYLELNFVYPNSLENVNQELIQIYPNPANDVLNISGAMENSLFEIFDIQGRKITTEVLSSGTNTINTIDFREGLYFYQIEYQRGKFLIQR